MTHGGQEPVPSYTMLMTGRYRALVLVNGECAGACLHNHREPIHALRCAEKIARRMGWKPKRVKTKEGVKTVDKAKKPLGHIGEFLTRDQVAACIDRTEGTWWDEGKTPPTVEEVVGHLVRMQNTRLHGADHLVKLSPHYVEGDADTPFFSEAYLYNLLGKECGRTVLAQLRTIVRMLEALLGRKLPYSFR